MQIFFPAEAHRALELLEEYHAKLTSMHDKQLRAAIERVIRIFKSRLFQALLGKRALLFSNFQISRAPPKWRQAAATAAAARRCQTTAHNNNKYNIKLF